jgi:putative transposase
MKGYMTIQEASEKWGIGQRRINTLCHEGRIKGASKLGRTWAIPKDAEKPKDERIKSGKYIKNSQGDNNELIC